VYLRSVWIARAVFAFKGLDGFFGLERFAQLPFTPIQRNSICIMVLSPPQHIYEGCIVERVQQKES